MVILSMDYKKCKAEIKTIDAQDSYKGGVVVQVTGCLIVKDNMKRKFTQSFYLTPQDKGYFVLNDIFRYVIEYEMVESDTVAIAVNGVTENATSTPVTPDPEVEVSYGNGEVVHEPSCNGELSTVEVEVVEAPVHSGQDEVLPATEPASTFPEDTPKKSYASIIKVMKETTPVHVHTNIGPNLDKIFLIKIWTKSRWLSGGNSVVMTSQKEKTLRLCDW
ncbi:hypothetical protein IFM89_010709 [Coptis chinensis]|uniref:NTF2 domain-containing protein n=1 Tax=Coptis chinensis TaxID=261450 RepID=A0A835IMM9_9MAGN|nr:hypothetical protein IFM89_010709 [Coptis chinensis]